MRLDKLILMTPFIAVAYATLYSVETNPLLNNAFTVDGTIYGIVDLKIPNRPSVAISSMVETDAGFMILTCPDDYNGAPYGKGATIIKVDNGNVVNKKPVENPDIPGVQNMEGRSPRKIVKHVFPNGEIGGMATGAIPGVTSSGEIDHAFVPMANGGGLTFLPPPDPLTVSSKFNRIGISVIEKYVKNFGIYGWWDIGLNDQPLGCLPVRWSISNGKWECKSLIKDIEIGCGFSIETVDDQGGVYLTNHWSKSTTESGKTETHLYSLSLLSGYKSNNSNCLPSSGSSFCGIIFKNSEFIEVFSKDVILKTCEIS